MASIELSKVFVEFPIYNASSRSLKKRLVRVATGGQIDSDNHGRVIIRALSDVSLSIRDGERVGIVGHNGSGKSTMLRLMGGVYGPTSGTAEISGSIGSLIDISLGIDSEATGRENIFLRGVLLGIPRSVLEDKCEEIIDFSEIGEFIDMPVRTYSSGMHLRLAFSISTIIRPEILIMDEWLSVGDEGFKSKVKQRMSELVQASSILIVASHSPELIREVCTRVLWLEHGVVKLDGSLDEVVPKYFGATA